MHLIKASSVQNTSHKVYIRHANVAVLVYGSRFLIILLVRYCVLSCKCNLFDFALIEFCLCKGDIIFIEEMSLATFGKTTVRWP